jgi:hypothetical protein
VADTDHSRAILERHVAALMEHFDAVQVFATRFDDRETQTFADGAGNWNARRGMVAYFIRRQDQIERMELVAELADDGDD